MNCLVFASLAAAYLSYFLFIIRFKLKKDNKRNICILGIISIITGVLLTFCISDYVLAIFGAPVYSLIMLLLLMDCTRKQLIAYFIHAGLTFSIIVEIIGNFLNIIFGIEDPINNIISQFSLGLICWILFHIYIRKIPINAFLLPNKYAIRLLLIQLALVLMSTMCLAGVMMIDSFKGLTNSVVSIGSLALLLVYYGIIYYFNVSKSQNTKLEGLSEYNEQQKYYYELLLSKEEQTRKFRHDIENDLLQIQYYIDKKDVNKTSDKINQMLTEVNGIRKKNYTVGIELIDVILNYYLVPVKDEVKIQINSSISNNVILDVDDSDLCIVIANMIKNAIEATMFLPIIERQIVISINAGKKNLYMKIDNTYDVSRKEMIIEGTSKDDKNNHGFGTEKIEEIVKKYDGTFLHKEQNNHYISEIYFTI